jgi:hypothetical protein
MASNSEVSSPKYAQVHAEKITRYLLSDSHTDGRTKAAFFKRRGFRQDNWRELAEALVAHAMESHIANTKITEHGIKQIIEGWLQWSDGSRSMIRAIWFGDQGSSTLRFVTAYPLKKARSP